jgi:hypothetical protein
MRAACPTARQVSGFMLVHVFVVFLRQNLAMTIHVMAPASCTSPEAQLCNGGTVPCISALDRYQLIASRLSSSDTGQKALFFCIG